MDGSSGEKGQSGNWHWGSETPGEELTESAGNVSEPSRFAPMERSKAGRLAYAR